MILISPAQIATLGNWLTPERPSLVALHILNTGNGACFVDRWPEPRTVLLTIGTLCSLIGNPGAFPADDLRRYVAGLMFAPEEFVPLLKEVFPDIREVERIVLELQEVPRFVAPPDFTVRRLASADAHHGFFESFDDAVICLTPESWSSWDMGQANIQFFNGILSTDTGYLYPLD